MCPVIHTIPTHIAGRRSEETYRRRRADSCRRYHTSQGLSSLLGPCHGAVDGGFDALRLKDVAHEELGAGPELRDEIGAVLLVHVEDGDVSARFNQLLDACLAKTGRTVSWVSEDVMCLCACVLDGMVGILSCDSGFG